MPHLPATEINYHQLATGIRTALRGLRIQRHETAERSCPCTLRRNFANRNPLTSIRFRAHCLKAKAFQRDALISSIMRLLPAHPLARRLSSSACTVAAKSFSVSILATCFRIDGWPITLCRPAGSWQTLHYDLTAYRTLVQRLDVAMRVAVQEQLCTNKAWQVPASIFGSLESLLSFRHLQHHLSEGSILDTNKPCVLANRPEALCIVLGQDGQHTLKRLQGQTRVCDRHKAGAPRPC